MRPAARVTSACTADPIFCKAGVLYDTTTPAPVLQHPFHSTLFSGRGTTANSPQKSVLLLDLEAAYVTIEKRCAHTLFHFLPPGCPGRTTPQYPVCSKPNSHFQGFCPQCASRNAAPLHFRKASLPQERTAAFQRMPPSGPGLYFVFKSQIRANSSVG